MEIEAAALSLEEARSSLEEAVLVAPFDGVVVAVEVDPGDVVAATVERIGTLTNYVRSIGS